MRVLGIDPGLRVTGYGLVSAPDNYRYPEKIKVLEAGIVETGSQAGIAERLKKIFDSLSGVIKEFHPDVLTIEKLYAHHKHPTTAILMGHARGVVCLLSGIYGKPLVSIPSTHIKKAVSGMGHAGKAQVQRAVQQILSLKNLPEPPDVADALAVAITYLFSLTAPRVSIGKKI